ncbi:2'-5' RNA ligase family protein [Arsenicicoccus dermatophilus]|uniref:2'-5' RNA ligase family protein n=1 Tax=Arsenicicoccus dermatophilus TaxID=1076331 RepID=UPI001F4CA75F|nr:2'-5' RNA ligase family protein [Arsenicicoccus dermatophilus]MCH8612248.1 2'-5' RNA ligase family protein [Arsenicicoccus dermatophilus]
MPVIGVSVAVPEPWGGELQRARLSYGDQQAVGIPTHVTVLPPTQISDQVMDEVHGHLRQAAARVEPFRLDLRGTGTFLPVSPVVFVQVARGVPACEQLEREVRRGLLERPLSFTYHPHVTVAHNIPEEALERAYRELAGYYCGFVVEEIHLHVQGADEVWRPLERYRLGGATVRE